MKTSVQQGRVLDLTAPTGGVVSGQGYVIGATFAVAGTTVAAGALFPGALTGAFLLTKLSTAVIAEGAKVSWDNTNKRLVAPGTGFFPIGVAAIAMANGETTGTVRLDGIATAAA